LFENGSTQGGNRSWYKFSLEGKVLVHLCHVPAVTEQLLAFPCDLLLHVTSMHQNHSIDGSLVSRMKHANRQMYVPIIHLLYATCTKNA
jgi:hypothetical protein